MRNGLKSSLPAYLLMGMLLLGCQKKEQINIDKKEKPFSVEDARQWYEKTSPGRASSSAKTTTGMKTFTPVWDQALNEEDAKYYIIELPLNFEKPSGFLISQSEQKPSKPEGVNGITRLLILKDKQAGTVQSALMHIYSGSGSVPPGINYSNRMNFSGYIFYTDLGWQFINGWQYENGKIIRSSNGLGSNNSNGSGQRMAPTTETCTIIETDIYERTCYYYNNGAVNCTEWEWVGSTFQTYCTTTNGGGGGGGGYEYETCNAPNPSEVLAGSSSISQNVGDWWGSETTDPVTNKITKSGKHNWYFSSNSFLNYSWKYKSFDEMTAQKINNTWILTSITHKSVLREGTIPPCTSVDINVYASTFIESGGRVGFVNLDYTLTVNITCCKPCPPTSKIFKASSQINAPS